VTGIAITDLPDGSRAQVILVDTPGIFRIQRRRLERAMVSLEGDVALGHAALPDQTSSTRWPSPS